MATIRKSAPIPPGTTPPFVERPAMPTFVEAFGASNRDQRDGATEENGSHRTFTVLVTGLFIVYMAVAVGIYLWRGIFFKPDMWALLLLVGALVLGRLGPFLRDWIPFVLLVFGYEYLRGIAGTIVADGRAIWRLPREAVPEVHLEGLIRFDEVLFGGSTPPKLLQNWLYVRGTIHWYDYFALVVYSMHFVLPCLFAFVLWLTHKSRFWQFTLTFCFMTYAAFAFFLLYPAAPPWLAEQWGITEGIGWPPRQVVDAIAPDNFAAFDALSIWGAASPHPVAAMPSLHASFPWLVMMFAVKYFRWWGLVFIPYNLALWFSVVYTANHWVVDILAGIAWAIVSFAVVEYVWYALTVKGGPPVPAPMRAVAATAYRVAIAPVARVVRPIYDMPGHLRRRAGTALRKSVGPRGRRS
ncbi:MAG: inositol phosphorylceramide synthase [Chloroflexia bacterium]|nr:inositol phosphorylceramide synthase [Chloroflexia bacterium]